MAYLNPNWVREFRGIVGQANNSPPPGRRSLGSTCGVVLSFLKAFFFNPFDNQVLIACVHLHVYTSYYCTVLHFFCTIAFIQHCICHLVSKPGTKNLGYHHRVNILRKRRNIFVALFLAEQNYTEFIDVYFDF